MCPKSLPQRIIFNSPWMNGFTTVPQYQWSSGKTITSYVYNLVETIFFALYGTRDKLSHVQIHPFGQLDSETGSKLCNFSEWACISWSWMNYNVLIKLPFQWMGLNICTWPEGLPGRGTKGPSVPKEMLFKYPSLKPLSGSPLWEYSSIRHTKLRPVSYS